MTQFTRDYVVPERSAVTQCDPHLRGNISISYTSQFVQYINTHRFVVLTNGEKLSSFEGWYILRMNPRQYVQYINTHRFVIPTTCNKGEKL